MRRRGAARTALRITSLTPNLGAAASAMWRAVQDGEMRMLPIAPDVVLVDLRNPLGISR